MKTNKTKLALVISAIVSINLVASAIPAQSVEIQLRDMHTAEFCTPGVYLNDMDLSYTDFSGCDLNGANFNRSDLTGANFHGAILRGAYFDGATMGGSFAGVDFDGALLGNATLSGNFTKANFGKANLIGGKLSGSFQSANFYFSRLDYSDMSGDFTDSSFYAADLKGTILRGDFARASFQNITSDLASTSFTGHFSSANFREVTLYGANLEGNFDNADFSDANLAYAHLDGSFQKAVFTRTFFALAHLDGDFDFAKFSGQQPSYGFNNSVFTGSFFGTQFSNVHFSGPDLSEVDLSLSNFSGQMSGYFWPALLPKAWPTGWTYCGEFGGHFYGPNQDLSNTTLGNGSYCDVSAVDWTNTIVENSTFYGHSFVGANLVDLKLYRTKFSSVDFSRTKIKSRFSGGELYSVKFVNSDLTESKFDQASLFNLDFSGANLSGVDFTSANLNGANFNGANLSGVDFTSANLNGANFSGANLKGANFTGSILSDVDFSSVNLVGANFSGAYLYSVKNFDCGGTNLLDLAVEIRDSDIHGCTFSNHEEFHLSNSKFSESTFTNVKFSNPDNTLRADFYNTTIENASFISTNTSSLKFVGGALINAEFPKKSIFWASQFETVRLTNVKFEGLFAGSNFKDMNLAQVKFFDRFFNINFVNCNLQHADFTNVESAMNLTFEDSDLSYADFSRLSLMGIAFVDSDLTGANFYKTSLSSIRSHNINGTPVNMNHRYLMRGGFILGPSVQLLDEDLSNFDFSGVNLSNAAIVGSNISGAKFANSLSMFGIYGRQLSGLPDSLAKGFVLLNGTIVGPGVSIDSGANLRGVNLGYVDLSFALFAGANIEGSDFSRAKFRGTVFCSTFADSSTLTPEGVFIARPYYGGGAKLVGAGVRECPPNGNVWTDSPVWFADTSDFSGKNFEGADLRNFAFRYGDFARANFRNANLSSTVFTGSDLSGADLRGANLTNANFGGAVLDGALMTGIVGAPAYLPDGWVYLNGSIIRQGNVSVGMKLVNSKCASGSEELPIDADTKLSLLGDASYSNILSMDTTQGFNSKGSCVVWFIDGAVVSSANKLTFTPSSSDIGKKVRVGVVRTDLTGTKTIQLSDELLIGKARMNSTVPTVSGVAKVGGRLTALRTTWAPGAAYSYQWFRDGSVIEGATKVSYLPTTGDFQQTLAVRVCATKAYFETKCETSSASAKVAPGGFPKSPVVQLAVGKLTVGSTLVGKPGNWLTGTSLSFQWLRDGVAIQDANLASYTLSSEDRGHVIQFQVTASKRGYVDQVKSSITKSIP